MWPLDWIYGLAWRLTRPRLPDLVVDQEGFSLCKHGKVLEQHAWGKVEKVIAFKIDRGVYDEICSQIDLAGRGDLLVVSEDFGGYSPFVEAMEKELPGVKQGWWSRVAFPAFAENATVVFLREPVTDA